MNCKPQKCKKKRKYNELSRKALQRITEKVSQRFLFGEVYTEYPWAAAPNSTTANNHLLNGWHAQYKKKYLNKTFFRKM